MFWEHNIYKKCFCVLIGKLTAAEIVITAKADVPSPAIARSTST